MFKLSEENIIPRLDLSQFVFTPPGPMGWTFEITEDEIENAKKGILSIIEAEERLIEFGKIYELELKGKVVETDSVEKKEEVHVEEVIEEEPTESIRIILPTGPLKAPWLPQRKKKRR